MSEQIISFESFAKECEHLNEENEDFAECLHKDNYKENCIEGVCPLCRLASLEDLKTLDPELYEEEKRSFAKELADGEDESELLPCDYGADWVVVAE